MQTSIISSEMQFLNEQFHKFLDFLISYNTVITNIEVLRHILSPMYV